MNLKCCSVVVLSLGLLSGCSEATPDDADRGEEIGAADGGSAGRDASKPTPSKDDPGARTADPIVQDAGSDALPSKADAQASVPPATLPEVPTDAKTFDYLEQEVALSADLVIPRGKTVRVGPGVRFSAKSKIKVQVLGALIVEGSAAQPSSFLGGAPSSWHGIVVEPGGKLTLSHAKIGGAQYGLLALPGSDFAVSNSEIGTSFKGAVVQSDGTFSHVVFNASTPLTISLADQVSMDDPNGTLTIMDASPTITDCQFNGSSGFTDMVRIGGSSSPTFDHVHVRDAHCGFHTFGGTNTSPRITHAIFENLSYGIMAYTTKPIVESSVFRNNAYDIGICSGATVDNAAVLTNNFYAAGQLSLDASCFRINVADTSPAKAEPVDVGPSGL